MSGKRLRGPEILPPSTVETPRHRLHERFRLPLGADFVTAIFTVLPYTAAWLKRRTASASDTNSIAPNAASLQSPAMLISSQPAQHSGLEYVQLSTSNPSVVGDMLSGLRHDSNRSDLFIGLALLLKRDASLFQSDLVVQQLVQFLMHSASLGRSLHLVAEIVQQAFSIDLPLQIYKFYIDSMLMDDSSTCSKWLNREELQGFVSKLRWLSSPPPDSVAISAFAKDSLNSSNDDEEELIQESGSVSVNKDSLNLQHQVGAYVMLKVGASPTLPNPRTIQLLSQACGLAECRLGAIRLLASLPSSMTPSGEIADLIQSLAAWVVNRGDLSLLYGLLSLPITARSLGSVLGLPQFWQAALSFVLAQEKITIQSQPDLFHALFSQTDLVRTLLPNFCFRYVATLGSETRPLQRLQAILNWASLHPSSPAAPYLPFPDFPLLLLSLAETSNLPLIGLASVLGNARHGAIAADFQLEAVRILNQRFAAAKGSTTAVEGEAVTAALQLLLSQNVSVQEHSFPVHRDTILHLLSLSLVHHCLPPASALALLECVIVRSIAQPIPITCGADDARSICEAIMQLSIVTGNKLSVRSALYWKAVVLLVLLSSSCPGSIGAFAYRRIGTIREVLNSIITDSWEAATTIAYSSIPETFSLDLSAPQAIPEAILIEMRHLAITHQLPSKIIGNDGQFQLVALFCESQPADVLCAWLVPALNEIASRRDSVPIAVVAHLLLHLGLLSPPFCLSRIRSCLGKYSSPDKSPAAASVILLFLRALSSEVADSRLRARTALQIACHCAPNQPLDFLQHQSVVDLGEDAIKTAIQAEWCPRVLSHYVRFLLDRYRVKAAPESSIDVTLLQFLFKNVLCRTHVVGALLTDVGDQSGLLDLVRSLAALCVRGCDSVLPASLLLDVIVAVASHDAIPADIKPKTQEWMSSQNLSVDHAGFLLDGCSDEQLQLLAVKFGSCEQLRLFAKGFGRTSTAISACHTRLRELGWSEQDSVTPMQDSEQNDKDFDAAAVCQVNKRQLDEDIIMVPAPLELRHTVSLVEPIPKRRLANQAVTTVIQEVITPCFFPAFHTCKHGAGFSSRSGSDSTFSKEGLLRLWRGARYDELLTVLRDLCTSVGK